MKIKKLNIIKRVYLGVRGAGLQVSAFLSLRARILLQRRSASAVSSATWHIIKRGSVVVNLLGLLGVTGVIAQGQDLTSGRQLDFLAAMSLRRQHEVHRLQLGKHWLLRLHHLRHCQRALIVVHKVSVVILFALVKAHVKSCR